MRGMFADDENALRERSPWPTDRAIRLRETGLRVPTNACSGNEAFYVRAGGWPRIALGDGCIVIRPHLTDIYAMQC